MNSKRIYKLKSLHDLEPFVISLLEDFPEIRVFCLYGDLGAGKTTICKEIIGKLTGIKTVTSPTFNIVQIYDGTKTKVYHYDLYRIKDQSELYEIGLLENLSEGYSLIEWPEIAENFLATEKKVNIRITCLEDDLREIVVGEV
jgi:tRNA threonylcarbamoyladenosine biosynthesis protein TsaE